MGFNPAKLLRRCVVALLGSFFYLFNLFMTNWIKIYRSLLSDPLWQLSTPEQKSILITVLLMANYTPTQWEWKGEKFECQPGQFITSLERIAAACGKGIKTQNVRTALARFEKLKFLTNESTKTGRLITICKWESYQVVFEEPNKEPNKDLTKTSQRPNKDLTTNKNNKEEKNINKDKEKNKFTVPTVQEIEEYKIEISAIVNAQAFYDYYEANGWIVGKVKMKNWKAAFRQWNSREKEKEKSCAKKEKENGYGQKLPYRVTGTSFPQPDGPSDGRTKGPMVRRLTITPEIRAAFKDSD